ncbi:hypothetical protein [Halobacteriovorax sp. YZS-1-1]|uniref:hypothetical protein n=1 Tax=unclassified Halobacteriovorax TaxID=2639665 RepID=UPI0039997DFC
MIFSIWPFSILKNRYLSRDWVGVWYEILKERGENDQCVIGRAKYIDGDIHEPQYFEYSHSLMDGSASIPFYLTKLGAKRGPIFSNYKKEISFFDHIKLAFRAKDISPAHKPDWKIQSQKRPKNNYEFALKALSVDETKKFNDYLKENKLSQNIVILELLNRFVFELIKEESQNESYSWLLPINIRGIVNKINPYENHTSFVQMRLNANSTYESIRKVFSAKVKTLNHIGLWWVHHIGVLFGRGYMAKLSRKSAGKNFWLGTFSNVGSWDVRDETYNSLGEQEVWFATTPGSRNFPIGLVAMEFNAKLSLTLKVHPFISENHVDTAKRILDKITTEIRSNYS